MKLHKTAFSGTYLIEANFFPDLRGSFVKIFSQPDWQKLGLETEFRESYYSISHRGVIRGMHFQKPPFDHVKLVYVPAGKIVDVFLDIRANSATYGQHLSFEISAQNHFLVYIPVGIAHGFEALTKNTIVTYLQTTEHHPEADLGIHIQSFGMKWHTKSPILSQRDQQFPSLQEFITPFKET